jgi:magnesium chelatase family protein
MLAKVHSVQIIGLRADIIDVEVDISKGLHSFSIVGLPDKAVEEARDRINAGLKNSRFETPQKGNRKIIVSLAPADLKKEGTLFDLAIAVGFLLANKEIRFDATKRIFLGELGLNGDLRPIKGALLLTKKAKEAGFEEVYLPVANAEESALIRGIKIFPCDNLRQLADHLSPPKPGSGEPPPLTKPLAPQPETKLTAPALEHLVDFAEVRGQQTAKRGLEIAAAGGHNIAMYGPPGTGKTMLARAFTGILPNLNFDEAIEATGIHSAAGSLAQELICRPPFRSPHHTSSYVSLVGGGTWPKPGEVTLAHRGVLFLDEFPEFDRRVIESLRQPLEDRVISIARAKGSMIFPADFILIAAMNPCPCGNKGQSGKDCICPPGSLARYQRKVSGPIIDRIDIWIEVPQIEHAKLAGASTGESSDRVRGRVLSARQKQRARFQNETEKITTNRQMGVRQLEKHATLTPECLNLLNTSAKRLNLSARAYHRTIKLALTIADLDQAPAIEPKHLLEALQYRPKLDFN